MTNENAVSQANLRKMFKAMMDNGSKFVAFSEGELLDKYRSEKDISELIKDIKSVEICEVLSSDKHWILFALEIGGIEVVDYTEDTQPYIDML